MKPDVREALTELVRLKDLKDEHCPNGEWDSTGLQIHYEALQPIAWKAARSALQAPTEREGVMVPREPTEEMVVAALNACSDISSWDSDNIYKAMLAARPSAVRDASEGKDAERYRWLRGRFCNSLLIGLESWLGDRIPGSLPDDLDAAIDAAIRAKE